MKGKEDRGEKKYVIKERRNKIEQEGRGTKERHRKNRKNTKTDIKESEKENEKKCKKVRDPNGRSKRQWCEKKE